MNISVSKANGFNRGNFIICLVNNKLLSWHFFSINNQCKQFPPTANAFTMYEFQSICRKKIAMIITGIGSNNSLRIYTGKIILTEKACYYFVSSSEQWEIEIERGIIKKLSPVQQDSKKIMLGADYYFSMEVTELKPSLFLQSLLNT